MTDGNPGDPNTRPMPWDAKPADAGATPPEPEPFDSSPTEVTPTPTPEPAVEEPAPEPAAPEPPTQPGLISAAPVGWGATQGSTLTPPTSQPGDPAAPAVGWAPPPSQAQVPGAPGLVFADTISRFVAFIIDGILVGIIGYIVAIFVFAGAVATSVEDNTLTGVAASVAFAVFSALYFVFFWTGGRRATPGQRLFKIQVGNAFDGAPLSVGQAFKRWLGYGEFLTLLVLVPALYGLANLALLLWSIILLITVVTSPTKQGLHDRFANSALVRPSGEGSSGLAIGCLIILAIFVLLPLLALVALVLLGSQVSTILSTVGESV